MGASINNESITTEPPPQIGQQPKAPGGLNAFYWCQTVALYYTVVKVKLTWRPSNYCNVSSQRNNLIKLTHYGETNKRVQAKEIIKLSHVGSGQIQASGTNQRFDALRKSFIAYEA